MSNEVALTKKPLTVSDIQRNRYAATISEKDEPVEQQLTLFNAFAAGTPANYTNILEFFDAIPKFALSTQTDAKAGQRLEIVQFLFKWNSMDCRVAITPVVIEGRGAGGEPVRKEILPGPREATIYRVLRKMASDPTVEKRAKGENVVLIFTLSNLRRRLEAVGHGFKLSDIRESLEVLAQAPLKVTNATNKRTIYSGPYIYLEYATDETDATGERTELHVSFNRLAVKAITKGLYDRIDYDRLMKLSQLGQWIYELITRNYRQAGAECGYTLSLSRIMRESGMKSWKFLRSNVKFVRDTFKELVEKDVLTLYPPVKEVVIHGPAKKGRRPIIDVEWTLFTSQAVNEDIRKDNAGKKAKRLE